MLLTDLIYVAIAIAFFALIDWILAIHREREAEGQR